jgi:nonsense-mediated mRNA decay protein 3
LADVTVARNSDFGRNDKQFFIRSHLGAVLNPGDTVLGYDLSTANINDSDLEGLRGGWNSLPEVVLVRKSYPVRRKKNRDRHWRLQALAKEREEQRKQQQFSDAYARFPLVYPSLRYPNKFFPPN